jgi:hypothetical protein
VTEQPAPPPAPTDVAPPPATPEAPAAPEPPHAEAWSLRRTLRTAASESWDLVAGEQRVGSVALQYGGDAVEGILALPADTPADQVRGVLVWLTDLLTLDHVAGPGGVIHWVVSTGPHEDFWRRSPGRRTTGAETDMATAKARVEAVLGAMFPDVTALPDGGYAVDTGSVRVFVQVRLVDGAVLVRVFAITNLDVPLDGDLPRFLLALNYTLALGRFSVDAERRSVWFDHVLTADDLDDGTLSRTIGAVAATADTYDDQVKERFGGRTFREEGSPVEQAAGLPGGPGMAGGYL